MFLTVAAILHLLFHVFAVDELIYVNGDGPFGGPNEMMEQGRIQYQKLQERGKLPKYGTCWTQAIEHIEESCRALTEDTQSDVALLLTNCFLDESGHETYNCVNDKKPNLRGICINSMSDRAFNVYIEFYTHTQNMCWFLRGQVWQETISENTNLVAKQLKSSAKNQEALLKQQRESLDVQEKILKYGNHLEVILGGFIESTKEHHEIIKVLTQTIANLQAWLMGEISWLDSVLFYLCVSFLIFFVTSTPRTFAARLPAFCLFTLNLFLERILCYRMDPNSNVDIKVVHLAYYQYIWYLRYAFLAATAAVLVYSALFYKDYLIANNLILEELKERVNDISYNLKSRKAIAGKENGFSYVRERSSSKSHHSRPESDCSDVSLLSPHFEADKRRENERKELPSMLDLHSRYNLRSRQATPDLNIQT